MIDRQGQMAFSSCKGTHALPPTTPGHIPPLSSDLPALVPEELAGILDDLLVCKLPKGLGSAKHQHLPQGHSEGPHVTGCCELPLAHKTARKTEKNLTGGRFIPAPACAP